MQNAWAMVNALASERLAMLPTNVMVMERVEFLREHISLLQRTLAVMYEEASTLQSDVHVAKRQR